MRCSPRIFSLIFFISFHFLLAQEADDRYRSFSEYFRTYPAHFARSCRDVYVLRANRYVTGVGIMGTTAALFIDKRIQKHVVDEGLMPDYLAEFGDSWGGGWGPPIVLTGVPVFEYLRTGDLSHSLETTEYVWETHIVTSLLTQILKKGIGRERPSGTDYRSFPSGHTSFAFATASILSHLYGKYVGLLGYSAAVIVGLSRINGNHHYLSDVFGGATLGIIIGNGFARSHSFGSKEENGTECFSMRLALSEKRMFIEWVF